MREDLRFAFAFIYLEIRGKQTNTFPIFYEEREMNEYPIDSLTVFYAGPRVRACIKSAEAQLGLRRGNNTSTSEG